MKISFFLPLLLFTCIRMVVTGRAQSPAGKPNIILLLADDLGWKDLSCYGSKFYKTPCLDSLAAHGIRFTQGYASSPVCSPTRASILTGKYPSKTGVTDWIRGRQENGLARPYEKLIADSTAYQLATEEHTIAELALERGYVTFYAGKWHLGESAAFGPLVQGFMQNKGGWEKGSPSGRVNDSTGGFFTPYGNPTLQDGPPGEYLTDRLTDECIEFIDRHQQTPFFLMYSLYAVHNPLQVPRKWVDPYRNGPLHTKETDRFNSNESWMSFEKDWKTRIVQDNPVYAGMVANMDWNIGRLIRQLKEKGLLDNTLIIFTSDNGGLSTAEGSPTSNLPLRGGKGWLYEGGIRVPFIIHWPNRIRDGMVSGIPVTTTDLFPTLAQVMDPAYRKAPGLDGVDLFRLLATEDSAHARSMIWYYPHYSNQGGRPGAAIRKGNYKLIYYFEDRNT